MLKRFFDWMCSLDCDEMTECFVTKWLHHFVFLSDIIYSIHLCLPVFTTVNFCPLEPTSVHFCPLVSRASSWSLRGCWRFLRGVLVVFDMVDAPRIHQGSYISIFRSVPAWEVLHLLCVSRVSSWSLRGRWRFLRGVLMAFDIVDASRIHQGSYISIFKSLPPWKVVQHQF